MGSDDLFKKRREARKKRKHDFKEPKPNSYLIVTEGKCTEPNYFKGLIALVKKRIGGHIDVQTVPTADIYGEGCSTCALIRHTEEIVNRANIPYQNVWVVFDKDDFEDFDQAIMQGREKGFHVAWSNQCFEYWIYLHFNYNDAALHREEIYSKLSEIFKQYGINNGEYEKNDKELFDKLNEYGSVKIAIKKAKSRMSEFNEKKNKPSEFAPGTTVHILVEELYSYIKK